MIRKTSLRRSRMRRKPRRWDNAQLRYEWASEHESCACCGFRAGQVGGHLETHHILKHGHPQEPGQRPGRIDDERNFIRLCFQFAAQRCHELAEGNARIPHPAGGYWPVLTLGMVLTLKAESDPEHFDLDWLTAVNGGWLPEMEPLPSVLLEVRREPETLP